VTWQSWRGPGLTGELPFAKPMSWGPMFPYGEHVGMILHDATYGQPKKVTFFDGKAWSTPAPTPVHWPVQVVASGEDVYAIDLKGPLSWYDGKAWKPLELPGREEYPRLYRSHGNGPGIQESVSQQYFSVCGDTTLFVEADKTGKKLLCWRRPKGGAWAGPQELVSEETPIADVAAPRYGRPGFTPVAYNCWSDDGKKHGSERLPQAGVGSVRNRELKPWIKVLRVPAR
jgi:hypothetical protein